MSQGEHARIAAETGSPVGRRIEIGRRNLYRVGDEKRNLLGYGRTMTSALDLVRRTRASGQHHPLTTDALFAVALAVAAFASLDAVYGGLPANDPAFSHGWTAEVVVSMLAITLPLAWRRRFPFSVAVVVVVAFLLARIVVHTPEQNITLFALWLTIYSAVVHGQRRFRIPVVALCYAALVSEIVREVFFAYPTGTHLAQGYTLVYNLVLLSFPCLLGAAIWSLRDRQRKLADQTVELQAERQENARQAVFAERVRIARELHDVVAHHVSVIGVQAGGARSVMGRQPALAAEALSVIEDSSRRAVAELHRLLGFLRRVDETDELAPQPGLAQLGELIDEAGHAELLVDLKVKGTARPLSSTLELSAYRIIQEALTNTRKHSSSTAASVRLDYGVTELQVEVLDDGPCRPSGHAERQGGLGLIGMRERTAMHGGHFQAGPRPGGGFLVRASFPLSAGAA